MAWTESVSGGSGAMSRYDDIGDCGLARGDSYVGGSCATVLNGDIVVWGTATVMVPVRQGVC